jgi:hypothetical protein
MMLNRLCVMTMTMNRQMSTTPTYFLTIQTLNIQTLPGCHKKTDTKVDAVINVECVSVNGRHCCDYYRNNKDVVLPQKLSLPEEKALMNERQTAPITSLYSSMLIYGFRGGKTERKVVRHATSPPPVHSHSSSNSCPSRAGGSRTDCLCRCLGCYPVLCEGILQ